MWIERNKKTPNQRFWGKIRDMIRTCKKWWLVKELHDDCKRHGMNLSVEALQVNAKHAVAREAFVLNAVKKSLNRLPRVLNTYFCIPYKNGNQDNPEKIKDRLHQYNSILDESIRENLVHVEPPNTFPGSDFNGQFLNPPNRPFFRTTDLGDKIISNTGLINLLWKECSGVWILIGWLTTLILAIIGTIIAIKVKQ